MQRTSRTLLVIAIVNTMVFAMSTSKAWAGGIDNNHVNPGASGSTISVSVSTGTSASGSASGSEAASMRPTGGTTPPRCSYYAISAQQAVTVGIPSHRGQGYWASVYCTSGPLPGSSAAHAFAINTSGMAYKAGGFNYVWISTGRTPSASRPSALLPSPLEVARAAEARAQLPPPGPLHFNPDEINGVGPLTIVNYSTWLWVNPDMWRPVRVTAAVGPVRATVTARPTFVTWDMGDGHSVVCDGPGLAWFPGEVSSPCTYSYRHSARRLTVTATVSWSIGWHSTLGQSGTFPALRTSSSAPLSVTQVETVNTPG